MTRISYGAWAITVAMAVSASPAEAQFTLTLVAGPTISDIATPDLTVGTSTGFFFGGGTSFPISERLSIDPYFAFVQKGGELEGGEVQSYDYIALPVLLSTSIPLGERLGLSLSGGPQVGLNVNCDDAGIDCSRASNFKSLELGS